MSDYPLVTLTVINSNGKEWLGDCLSSIVMTDYPNLDIIVIDNASRDGSVQFIKDNFSSVEVIENRRNIGFCKAANMGFNIAIERASEYVILSNPDIKVASDWMNELVKVAEEDKNIGILMPLHQNYSGDKVDPNLSNILTSNVEYIKDRDAGNFREKYEVTSAIGGCMMIRTNIIEKVGYMDAIYFLSAEDTDLSRRMIFHGYKVVVVTKSKIMHWHRILHKDKIDKRTGFLLFRNKFIFFLKDPNRSFLNNLQRYYFDKEAGALQMIKSWAPVSNLRYLALAGYVQLWIFLHLPKIFIRYLKDKKRI